MQNRAILLRSWGRVVGKERGQQELESVATTPNHGRAGHRRLGFLDLSFSPCLFPLSFPSCLSLVQVSSSLRADILRALVAFAGSAILLMDFGVTNWVCFQMPQQWENMENGRVISRTGGRQKFTALGSQGPGL